MPVPTQQCQHESFSASVDVSRDVVDGRVQSIKCQMRLKCDQCGKPMPFAYAVVGEDAEVVLAGVLPEDAAS